MSRRKKITFNLGGVRHTLRYAPLKNKHGDFIPMVNVGDQKYLWDAFLAMRPCKVTGMGREPWDWTNIVNFVIATGRASLDEVELLSKMSAAYVSFAAKSEDPMAESAVEEQERLGNFEEGELYEPPEPFDAN